MRTAPPVHIRCSRGSHDRWWLAAWTVASAIALSVALLWCALHWAKDGASMRAARALSPMLCLLLGLSGLQRAWHNVRQGWQLRWDGQCWWLRLPAQALDEHAGQIRVAIDLGRWLLLHFRPDPVSVRWRSKLSSAWLTVSQSRHTNEWHRLRCAVYSPRPAAPATPAATYNTGVSCPATVPDER